MVKMEDVLRLLPGGDCNGFGGCGCLGCAECAQKITEVKNPALCPACSQNAANEIAQLLGADPVEVTEKVAFIRCSSSGSERIKAAGFDTCEGAKKRGFASGECQCGCLHIGSCMELCNFNAMYIEDGDIRIDKEVCNGCGACISGCPQDLITMVPRNATVFIPCASRNDEDITRQLCGSGCIGCGDCENACPENAVKIVDNCAVIDYEKCVGCIACSVKCRKKIVVDTLHNLAKHKEQVAFVRCCGGKKAFEAFSELGVQDCKEASKLRNEWGDLCKLGCVGLENCTKVCRFSAIEMVDGSARVDVGKCVGCLDCVDACPNNLIVPIPYKGTKMVACVSSLEEKEKLKLCGYGCIGCGDCEANCPENNIQVTDSCAVVDPEHCENCNICTYVCSKYVLREINVPEYTYLQREALGR